jgi:predicted RNA-binding Zn ribbon-like protein
MTAPLPVEQRPRWLPVDTGAPWLALLATVGGAYGPAPQERLVSPARLANWLAAQGIRPLARPTAADLDSARTLREALRALALGVVHGRTPDAAHLRAVNKALTRDVPLTLARTNGADLATTRPANAGQALARIARQAAEHLTGPQARALRQCADTDCGLLFLDPANRRRWCSLETCGVRNRVRAHRARRRAAAT